MTNYLDLAKKICPLCLTSGLQESLKQLVSLLQKQVAGLEQSTSRTLEMVDSSIQKHMVLQLYSSLWVKQKTLDVSISQCLLHLETLTHHSSTEQLRTFLASGMFIPRICVTHAYCGHGVGGQKMLKSRMKLQNVSLNVRRRWAQNTLRRYQ